MEREINFKIKDGVYCSWCADLMEKDLRQNFSVKRLKIDILKNKISLVSYKRISLKDVISFLKKRGYCLITQ